MTLESPEREELRRYFHRVTAREQLLSSTTIQQLEPDFFERMRALFASLEGDDLAEYRAHLDNLLKSRAEKIGMMAVMGELNQTISMLLTPPEKAYYNGINEIIKKLAKDQMNAFLGDSPSAK